MLDTYTLSGFKIRASFFVSTFVKMLTESSDLFVPIIQQFVNENMDASKCGNKLKKGDIACIFKNSDQKLSYLLC